MPAVAPSPVAQPSAAPAQTPTLGAGMPGAGQAPQISGYNAALGNLNSALQASNNTTSGQQMQLGQQLQQNQGAVQQNLINKGLGNTTVAETLQQAPLQSYNQALANIQNQGAERQMSAYDQLAQTSGQAGQAVTQTQQPYAQSNFAMGLQNQLSNQQAIRSMLANQQQGQGQQSTMNPNAQQGGYMQGPMAGQPGQGQTGMGVAGLTGSNYAIGQGANLGTAYAQYVAGSQGGAVANNGSYVGSEVDPATMQPIAGTGPVTTATNGSQVGQTLSNYGQ